MKLEGHRTDLEDALCLARKAKRSRLAGNIQYALVCEYLVDQIVPRLTPHEQDALVAIELEV